MEIDHIIPRNEQGPSTYDNGIPVCLECHAEIHSYNDKHPRGRKFQPEELRQHRDQWFELCKSRPEVFNTKFLSAEVGPLQALVDELEFNRVVATQKEPRGCLFLEEQFKRAISLGSVAILHDDLKKVLIDAYVAMGAANQRFLSAMNFSPGVDIHHVGASKIAASCSKPIEDAYSALLKFFASEET